MVSNTGRVIAVGDIHGCLAALDALLGVVTLEPGDLLVSLGDAIDRGPDSRGVIDRLLELKRTGFLVPILGNHDQMLLEYLDRRPTGVWLTHGGQETLESYGGEVDPEHGEFLRSWADCYETEEHFFAHGNFDPELPLDRQPWQELRWESLVARVPGPHVSGKTAVLGHTANKRGEVINLGHLVCIDTWCFGGGWLTAFEPATGRVWQARQTGETRETELPRRRASIR
ncbi:MAG: metallophosphoesterase family protein [Planctomycetota bacterium]